MYLKWKKHQIIRLEPSTKLRWFKNQDNSVNSAWSWNCKTTHAKRKQSMVYLYHRSVAWSVGLRKYGRWTSAFEVQWTIVFRWAYETYKTKGSNDPESSMLQRNTTPSAIIASNPVFSTCCKIRVAKRKCLHRKLLWV